jgi:hypothetical protein
MMKNEKAYDHPLFRVPENPVVCDWRDTRYRAQQYLSTLATTPEAAECQQRALARASRVCPVYA